MDIKEAKRNSKKHSRYKKTKSSSPLLSSTDKTVGGFHPDTFMLEYKNNLLPLTAIREKKDREAKLFRLETHVYSKITGERLIDLDKLHEKLKKKGAAERNNIINSIIEMAEKQKLDLCFVTITLDKPFHGPTTLDDVMAGNKMLQLFQTNLRKDMLFREPTAKLKKARNQSQSWSYIPKDKFHFISMKEFHKDWALHNHIAYFLPKERMLDFIDVLVRKHARQNMTRLIIGRMEIAVPEEYKSEVHNVYRC